MPAGVELPLLTVADVAAWALWLKANATTAPGVWLSLARKGATRPTSLTWDQAVEEALCHGWIDGQAKKSETAPETCRLARFTPRRPKSSWSQRNVSIVERLEAEGRMFPAGQAAVQAAKADGRWAAAYAGSANATPPQAFLDAVAASPRAQAVYDVLTSQNRFAIYYRIQSLKTEVAKERRIQAFVEMLERGETPHPQKKKPEAPLNGNLVPTNVSDEDITTVKPLRKRSALVESTPPVTKRTLRSRK